MKQRLKKLLPLAVVGVLSAATTVGTFKYFENQKELHDFSYFTATDNTAQFAGVNAAALGDDFVKAAKITVPAVVTIKNYQSASGRSSQQDIFDYFFGDPFNRGQQRAPRQSSGGGGGYDYPQGGDSSAAGGAGYVTIWINDAF